MLKSETLTLRSSIAHKTNHKGSTNVISGWKNVVLFLCRLNEKKKANAGEMSHKSFGMINIHKHQQQTHFECIFPFVSGFLCLICLRSVDRKCTVKIVHVKNVVERLLIASSSFVYYMDLHYFHIWWTNFGAWSKFCLSQKRKIEWNAWHQKHKKNELNIHNLYDFSLSRSLILRTRRII